MVKSKSWFALFEVVWFILVLWLWAVPYFIKKVKAHKVRQKLETLKKVKAGKARKKVKVLKGRKKK